MGRGQTSGKSGSKWLSSIDYIVNEALALVVVSAILFARIKEEFIVDVAFIFNFNFVDPFAAHFWEIVLQTGRITEVTLLAVYGNILVNWQPVKNGDDK